VLAGCQRDNDVSDLENLKEVDGVDVLRAKLSQAISAAPVSAKIATVADLGT
jgi:hypothetical protein